LGLIALNFRDQRLTSALSARLGLRGGRHSAERTGGKACGRGAERPAPAAAAPRVRTVHV
jgi:hypothetical protein